MKSTDSRTLPAFGQTTVFIQQQPVRLHVDHTALRQKTGRGCEGKCHGRGDAERSARKLDRGSSEMNLREVVLEQGVQTFRWCKGPTVVALRVGRSGVRFRMRWVFSSQSDSHRGKRESVSKQRSQLGFCRELTWCGSADPIRETKMQGVYWGEMG